MRRLTVLLAVTSLGLAAVTNVKRLEWTDPQGRQPLPYAKWIAARTTSLGVDRIGTIARLFINVGR